MEGLLNIIRREVESIVRRFYQPSRVGVIAAYNPAGPSVQVQFPEDLDYDGNPKVTGWIPWQVGSAGSGWTATFAPALGMQAAVHFVNGESNSAYATGALHSQQQPSPGVPEGEMWLLHKSGVFIKLTGVGEIETNAGIWNHVGNLNVSGSIHAGGNAGGQAGCDGSFTTPTGQIVTVKNGLITNIY